jgi:hypothetical protein
MVVKTVKARELVDLIERGNLHDFDIELIEHLGYKGHYPIYQNRELEINDVGYSEKTITLSMKG